MHAFYKMMQYKISLYPWKLSNILKSPSTHEKNNIHLFIDYGFVSKEEGVTVILRIEK